MNAQFEEEGCATFIVLFYRPVPDSWRDFKTTTCSHFTPTASSPSRPLPSSPVPLTRSKAGQGFNCKFKPVFVSAMGKNRHLQRSRRLPPPFDLPLTAFCSSSACRQFNHAPLSFYRPQFVFTDKQQYVLGLNKLLLT